jgi:signal transduction histidine kinase
MSLSKAWQKRRGLGVFAALLLAMLALAILSVQSVYREAQVRRRLIVDTHRNIADVVSARLATEILETDRAIAGAIESLQDRSSETLLKALDSLEALHPWAQPLVLVSSSEQPIAPHAAIESEVFQAKLSEAEHAEYQEPQSDRAARIYADAVREAGNPSDRAAALNGEARTRFKARDFLHAADAYKRLIAETYDLDREQVLLSVIARDQLIFCYRSLRKEPEAAAAVLDLYAFLIGHRFILGEESFAFYRERVESSLEEAEENGDSIAVLRTREARLSALPSALEESLGEISNGNRQASGPVRYVAAANGMNGTITRIRISGAAVEVVHIWDKPSLGLLLDNTLAQQGPWSQVRIALTEESEANAGRATVPLSVAPRWRVTALPESDSLDALASREVLRFAVLLALVFGTVLAAMILAARSVTRELALSRTRSDFVAHVSHELKTPLAAVRMFGESLREGWVGEEKKDEYYEVIVRESERLTGLINNVLDFSRIDSGRRRYQIARADLREIVSQLLDRYQYHLKAANIQLTRHLPAESVWAPVDREAIEQVLVNLLSNAVKYMGALDSRPREVHASLTRRGDEAVLRIADTGIGISEEDQQHIFDRFWRAGDERARGIAGSGLGLTLVKHIVEAHRGAVSVESAPGKGSTFAVSLPAETGGNA